MASSVIGALRVTLGIDTAAFQDGLNIAQKRMAATGQKLQAIGGKIATAGAGMSAAISLPFAALVKSSIPAAVESAQALAQVEAAVKSMGSASGRSVEQLQAQAGALQSLSNFDDDDILKSVTANLLTFGNVSGKVFDDAQLAIVNISARMGTDLQSAALMIGKALNVPEKGVKALTRVGIQFTAEQKEQIVAMAAAGDAAGAQAIMLGELNRQFGGAAKAQRDATPDAAMQEQWRTLQENIGAIALKVLPPLLDVVTKVATAFNKLSPETQTFAVGVGAVGFAIGPVAIAIGGLVKVVGALSIALEGLAAFLTVTLIPAAIATAPVWAPIVAVIGLAGAAFAALIKYQPQIDAFGERVVARMKALYQGVKTWLSDKLAAVFNGVRDRVKLVGDAFYSLWDRVVGHSYVPDMVDGISRHFGRLDGEMVGPAKSAISATAQAFEALQSRVGGLLDRLFPDQARMKQYRQDMADLLALAKQEQWSPESTQNAAAKLRNDYPEQWKPMAQSGDGIGNSDAIAAAAVDVDGLLTGVTDRVNEALGSVRDGMRGVSYEFAQLGTIGGNTFTDLADMIENRVGPAISVLIDKTASLTEKLSAAGSLVSSIFGAIFGKKAGRIIGGLFDAGLKIAGAFSGSGGASLPGFATGGSMVIQGMRGIDNNILSLNQKPIARVSHGETLGIGRSGGPAIVQLVVGEGEMFEPRVASISGNVSVQTVRGAQRASAMRGRQGY